MHIIVIKKSKKNLLKVFLMASALFGATNAFADSENQDKMTKYMENCDYLQTVLGMPLYDETRKNNVELQQVCIDMPVAMSKAKAVFNMDAAIFDGKGRPAGLRHMYMFGKAQLARIKMGLLDPEEVSIVGVIHGGALTPFTITPGDYAKAYLDEIFKLKQAGLNINIEVCGVTMLGKGYTNDQLYKSDYGMIHVNQGAIARILDLEQHKYAYYQEGK